MRWCIFAREEVWRGLLDGADTAARPGPALGAYLTSAFPPIPWLLRLHPHHRPYSSVSLARESESSCPNRSGKPAWKWSSFFLPSDKERARYTPGVVAPVLQQPPVAAEFDSSIPPSMISLSQSDESTPSFHDDAYAPAPFQYTISASLPSPGGAIFISTGLGVRV